MDLHNISSKACTKYSTNYSKLHTNEKSYIWYKEEYKNMMKSEYINGIDTFYNTIEETKNEMRKAYNIPFESRKEIIDGILMEVKTEDMPSIEYSDFWYNFGCWHDAIQKEINTFKKVYNESIYFSKLV